MSDSAGDNARMTPTERIDSDGGTFDLDAGAEGKERESGSAGLPGADDVPQETIDSIEADRAHRLDGDNRPDGAEVDNTHRHFDGGSGQFTDSEAYDPDDRPFAEDGDDAPPPSSSD